MAHHQQDLLLRIQGYVRVFWNNAADHFMPHFAAPLLVRSACVAVKNMRALITVRVELDLLWVREFASVVRKTVGEEPHKVDGTEFKIEFCKDVGDGLGIVCLTPVSELKAGVNERNRKQDGASPDPLDGVEGIRMLFHKYDEVFPLTSLPALWIDLNGVRFLPARAHADHPGHVNVSCTEQTIRYVGIKGTFAHHELCTVIIINMMQRLSFQKKRRNDTVQPFELQL